MTKHLRYALLLAALLPLAALLAPSTTAADQPVSRIAAIVDDDVVTMGDVEARLALTLLSAGLPANETNRRMLLPQTVRSLVDESLQLREAQRRGIEVMDDELAEAIETIAERNGMTVDGFTQMLRSRNVPLQTMERQVRATLAWTRLIQLRYVDALHVSQVDIDTYLRDLEANRGTTEHLLGEIFLAVDDAAQDAEVRTLAESLIREMRGGSRFSIVAQQFSQSANAAQGGDAGWVMNQQLGPELAEAVATTPVGQIAGPIRTLTGYHILLVRDRRQVLVADPGRAQLGLSQAILGYGSANPTQAQFEQAMSRARGLRNNATSCQDFLSRAGGAGTDIGYVTLRDMPNDLRRIVEPLSVGGVTEPLPTQEGVYLFMLCDRREADASLPSPDAVEDMLVTERVEVLQQRLLRDLRNAANIDIRVSL